MYEPSGRQFQNFAFLRLAFAAASTSDMAAVIAQQFADAAFGPAALPVPAPRWATPHQIALELKTMRLRDFSTQNYGPPALVCAPFPLHGTAIADLAPGHSLVATLLEAGLRRSCF